MMDEREIDSHNRGPLPNMLASESVTTAIDEAERQNRQQAIVVASVAVVLSLVATFILLQLLSGGDNSIATTTTSNSAALDDTSGSPDDGVTFGGSKGGATDEADVNETVESAATTSAPAVATDPATIDVNGFATPDSPVGVQPMTLRGMGEIALGMTVTEAQTAIGGTIIEPEASDADCTQTRIGGDVLSPVLMVIGSGDFADRKIMRIDMVSGNATRSGIGLGSLSAEVIEAYGERIDGDAGAGQLTYVPADEADADYRIVLDIVGDVVLDARNGVLPYVNWDGCNP